MPNSVETANIADVRRNAIETLYRAFNTGRPELLDDVLAEDWRDVPLAPGQAPGRAGLKPMVALFRAAFADVAFTPEEIVIANDRAAVRMTLSGRHIGDWMGVPATGRAFRIAAHELHRFSGDRITETWHLEDWAGWREQVGAAG